MYRVNHESVNLNQMYEFKNEVLDKYGKFEKIYDCFVDLFKSLPLGHILNKEVRLFMEDYLIQMELL